VLLNDEIISEKERDTSYKTRAYRTIVCINVEIKEKGEVVLILCNSEILKSNND
jgi:hypothetical protein